MITQTGKLLAARFMRKGIYPFLPGKAKLPFHYWITGLEVPVEGELLHLHRIVKKNEVAIDIGANKGLYSYKMCRLFSKVYAFEINDDLTEDLADYNPGNIEIINKGLSSSEGNVTLYIPVLNGLPLTGWASLAPNNCPETQEHIEKQVEICTLDTFRIRRVSFIKIDVEGHEMEVLEGAVQTLTSNRPVVLVEIKQQNVDKAIKFFSKLGYKHTELEDLIGIPGSEQNFIFIPEEKG